MPDEAILPQLETERLSLHPLELCDHEQVQLLFPTWEIVQYINNRVPWPYPPDGVCTYYAEVALPAMERGEAWHWTLREKTEPNLIIGGISLMANKEDNRGFWLGLRWHGRGLMTEASEEANRYWFEVLGFPVMRVSKAAANIASRRISEKNGMRLIGTCERDYVSGRLPSETWEITAAEWKSRRGR